MLARIVLASLALAPLLQAQVVEKVNGPLAGNVTYFTWTPDGRYVVYSAERDTPGIDVVTSLCVADGTEAVYDPYPLYEGIARAVPFVFTPDPELVGVRYSLNSGGEFPTYASQPLHILARSTAQVVTVAGGGPSASSTTGGCCT